MNLNITSSYEVAFLLSLKEIVLWLVQKLGPSCIRFRGSLLRQVTSLHVSHIITLSGGISAPSADHVRVPASAVK